MGEARRIEGKSVEELLSALTDSQVGSVAHEQVKAAIQVRIAELQREAARDSLTWAKIAARRNRPNWTPDGDPDRHSTLVPLRRAAAEVLVGQRERARGWNAGAARQLKRRGNRKWGGAGTGRPEGEECRQGAGWAAGRRGAESGEESRSIGSRHKNSSRYGATLGPWRSARPGPAGPRLPTNPVKDPIL